MTTRRRLVLQIIALIVAVSWPPLASSLTLVDETLIVDYELFDDDIMATDSRILVVEGGSLHSLEGAETWVRLHGNSSFVYSSSEPSGVVLIAADNSSAVWNSGDWTGYKNDLKGVLSGNAKLTLAGGSVSGDIWLSDTSTISITGGSHGGLFEIISTEASRVFISGGAFCADDGLGFDGASANISGGNFEAFPGCDSDISFGADRQVVSGGTFAPGSSWAISGDLTVRGRDLAMTNGRLTGFLVDDSPIDVWVSGSEHVSLAPIPEPTAALSFLVGLLLATRRGFPRR